jgi:regulator of protease activity HflC (stomatin/prohibitin superfamily)
MLAVPRRPGRTIATVVVFEFAGGTPMIHRINIRSFEYGLVFRNETFTGLLAPGAYWRFDPFGHERIEIVSRRAPWLAHEQLDMIVASGVLDGKAVVIDLADHERGLVWIDGRFDTVLPPGRYALWTGFRKVRTEVIDANTVRFEHKDREAILVGRRAAELLEVQDVAADHSGVLFLDGRYTETLGGGRYAFWKNRAAVKLVRLDRREQVLEVPGQEVLTADRVTLRLTAVGVYRVADPVRALTATDDAKQALYREVQLAVRVAVGMRTLDALLADKESLAKELGDAVKAKAASFGLDLITLGVRDLILPGDMKDLLNKVIEARTVAEASVITRREEAAALRHQTNAAKLFAENPTLLKLREIEAVERIAAAGKLNIVLGEKGLAERVVNLL